MKRLLTLLPVLITTACMEASEADTAGLDAASVAPLSDNLACRDAGESDALAATAVRPAPSLRLDTGSAATLDTGSAGLDEDAVDMDCGKR